MLFELSKILCTRIGIELEISNLLMRFQYIRSSSPPFCPSNETARAGRSERKAMLGFIYEHAAREGLCAQLASPRPMPTASARALYMRVPLEQFVTSDDLDVIRDSYNIPNSIIMSLPALHETSRDYHLGHLCLNEYMLGVGVRVPFEFGVVEALLAFHVSPARVTPHSLKVI
ncbi:hypothetical protein ACLOJK_006474 [Asimina triloba]